jgi:uncharacterized protein with PIN domain
MKPTYEQAMKLWRIAQERRSLRESRFDQCLRYAMPGRGSFFSTTPEKQIDDIFDETAIVGVQEFASRFQAAMTPNHSRWAVLEAGIDVPDAEKPEVNKALDAVTDAVFEVIHGSNFAQEAYEAYLDLSVTLGAIEVNEGDSLTPIINNAVSITSLWVLNGPYDTLDTFFQIKKKTMSDIDALYKGHTIPAEKAEKLRNSGKEATLLILTRQDYDEASTERHHRCIYWLEEKIEIWHQEYSGVGSCPLIAFRWGKTASDDWGMGPCLNALPAIKTANLVVQMVLENAQMAIAGVYTTDDDSVSPDTITILPGTIIPHQPGSRGLQALGPAGNFNVADIVLNDQRNNIKRALYNDSLGNPNKTPMSATEVAERMADLSRQIGSAFGRVWSEFCVRYLQRVVYILKKKKIIELPTVNGREVKISAKSPLSQAQNQIDIQNIDRLAEFVNARFGPQLANVFLKGEDIAAYVADKLQAPGKLVRTKPEMEEIIKGIAQMASAAQMPADPMAQQGAPPVG